MTGRSVQVIVEAAMLLVKEILSWLEARRGRDSRKG